MSSCHWLAVEGWWARGFGWVQSFKDPWETVDFGWKSVAELSARKLP